MNGSTRSSTAKVLAATSQRRKVHVLRDARPHAGQGQRHMVLAAITRLVGALLLEQNHAWQLQRRHMSLEAPRTLSDNRPARPPAVAS